MPIGVGMIAMALPVAAQTPGKGAESAWAGEARYWADHKSGDFADFLALFDEHFVGWPCDRATPAHKSDIKPPRLSLTRPDSVLDRKDETAGPGTVVVYYRATTRSDPGVGAGEPLIRNFTHTWVKTGEGWKIVGGMCRSAPAE